MPRTTTDERFGAREQRLAGLIAAALAGDEAAYRTFLRELAAHLRQFLRSRLFRRPDDVEDLVQECLLAVHNQRHTYDIRQPLTAWVQAIARYKLVDHLRRRGAHEVADEAIDDVADVLASAANDAADARRDIAKLLARLPDRHRLPIACTKIEGLSVDETARRLGMSPSAVKVGVHRGMKALAAMIRELP